MFSLLFVLDILALVSLLATPIVLFVSMFANDSPNANQFLVWTVILILWTFPLTAGVGGVMGLLAARRRNLRAMSTWTIVAYANPIALCLLWSVSALFGA